MKKYNTESGRRFAKENDTFQVVPFEKLLKKDETAIRRAVKTAFGKKIKVEMENLQCSL